MYARVVVRMYTTSPPKLCFSDCLVSFLELILSMVLPIDKRANDYTSTLDSGSTGTHFRFTSDIFGLNIHVNVHLVYTGKIMV